MSAESSDNPPNPTPPVKKKGGAAAKNGSIGLVPLTSALKAAAKGDFTARAELDRLEGDSAEVAKLLNLVLDQVSNRNTEFEARKAQTVQVVDQALDALIALVRQGELNRWTASNTTDDPLLGPLLEGFGKVIETLRTFVREINEAALRLS